MPLDSRLVAVRALTPHAIAWARVNTPCCVAAMRANRRGGVDREPYVAATRHDL